MDRVAIGNRVKSLLKNKKMTQGELAAKTGFTQSVISEMISGKRNDFHLLFTKSLLDKNLIKDYSELSKGINKRAMDYFIFEFGKFNVSSA